MEHHASGTFSPPLSPLFVTGGIWLLSYFVARYGMQAWAPDSPWDIAVASIAFFGFYGFVWTVQRALRRFDELQRRIHLEALALAFLIVMLTLMGLGLLVDTPRGRVELPLRDAWLMLIPLYGICYFTARRHYR